MLPIGNCSGWVCFLVRHLGCDNYILKSINHEMVLHEIKKSTLSIFDDKRCYINETESKPWNYYY